MAPAEQEQGTAKHRAVAAGRAGNLSHAVESLGSELAAVRERERGGLVQRSARLSEAPRPHGRPAGSIPGAEAVTLRAHQRLHDELQDAATLQVGGATRTSNLIMKHGAGCGL